MRLKWKTKYLVFHEWVMNYWNDLCHISEVVRLSFKKVISSEKLISVNPFILSGSYSRLHFLTDWKTSSLSSHHPRRFGGFQTEFCCGSSVGKTGRKNWRKGQTRPEEAILNTAAGELKTKNLENLFVMLKCCFKKPIWSLGKE